MDSPNSDVLQGKVAIVSGASRGIGRRIAMRLAQAGAIVGVNYYLSYDCAAALFEEIRQIGGRACLLRGDVGDERQIEQMTQTMVQEYGRVDILISNAATGSIRPAVEMSYRQWKKVMDVNAYAFVKWVQSVAPLMMEVGEGRIIALTSQGAISAIPDYATIGASKAALESLMRHFSLELARYKINVNAIRAGIIETDAIRAFPHGREMIIESQKKTPAGRLATPEDVADVVYLLCRQEASMIHGQTIVVDGGYSIIA